MKKLEDDEMDSYISESKIKEVAQKYGLKVSNESKSGVFLNNEEVELGTLFADLRIDEAGQTTRHSGREAGDALRRILEKMKGE